MRLTLLCYSESEHLQMYAFSFKILWVCMEALIQKSVFYSKEMKLHIGVPSLTAELLFKH